MTEKIDTKFQDCSRCIHVGATLVEPDEDDPDGLYLCNWMVDSLPVSMKYANRERGAVHGPDAYHCKCYKDESSA